MVVVFKTNVANQADQLALTPILDAHLKNVQWNFDLDDCDKIFRVEGSDIAVERIVGLFNRSGYTCEELPF